jgi:hypothetical protein
VSWKYLGPRDDKKWDLLPNILAEDRQYTKRIGSAFSKEKKNQPIAGKNLPAKPHKSGPSKKEEKTAKVLKVKKNGKKKSW